MRGVSLRSVALAFALLVLSAIVGEFTVRCMAARDDYLERGLLRFDPLSLPFEPHGEYGFRPKPNRSFAYPLGKVATSNAQRFRGPEVELPKPNDRIRILLLGGSPTHGWGVNDDETIDAFMRRALAERGRTDVDVVNLAMDAYDSLQIFERLRTEAPLHRPDVVIVSAGIVDAGYGRHADLIVADPRALGWEAALAPSRRGERPGIGARIRHASALVQFILLFQYEHSAAPPMTRIAARRMPVHPDAVEVFGENLRRIVGLADQLDAAVLLSTSPSGIGVRHDENDVRPYGFWLGSAGATERYRVALAEELRDVAREAAERGRRVVYVAPSIDGALFLDDAHLLPDGNRVVANVFLEAIQSWLIRADATTRAQPRE